MLFFRKKPKPPLEQAIAMSCDALEIAYKYNRDRKHIPTEEELKLLDQLRETFLRNYGAAAIIARHMHQRFNGEPEGLKKFTDPNVFDYHYPP